MFNLNTNFFGVLAAVVSVIAFFPYIFAILKGQTKPSGASWWAWTAITFVTVSSSWFAGASWQVLFLPLTLCFSQLAVAILSIKHGDNNWDITNKLAIGGAFLGVVLWLLTGQPLVALIIAILADICASIPNFRHVFTHPEQENQLSWALGWLTAVFEVLAMTTWSLAESGWAVYFLLNMSLTLFLVLRPMFAKLLMRS